MESLINTPMLITKILFFYRLDCGVIVCHILHQYVTKNEIPQTMSKEDCTKVRGEILHKLLTNVQTSSIPDVQEIINETLKDLKFEEQDF